MTRAGPVVVSLAGALALHLAVLAELDLPQGASGSGGQDGADLLGLEAVAGDIAALVAAWDRPPPPADAPAALRPALADAAAARPAALAAPAPVFRPAEAWPAEPDLPIAAATAPPEPAPPAAATSPPGETPPALNEPAKLNEPAGLPEPEPVLQGPGAPETSPRPEARPPMNYSGSGPGPSAGGGGSDAATRAADAARSSAFAAWGAEVRAAVERRKRRPTAAAGAVGEVTLIIEIGRDGALRAIAIAASSGIAALDQAARAAVESAAPFSPAPAALTDPAYALRLTLRFTP
ncbi:TonB family protein [Phaeovulum sp.]|uniref:TonB family protein n=1 Tax=Phaeovulum sp. TaxID=2934796 RepID=UPI002ABC52C9|nr:TonB family protein [Phaeovulum sp.]MDZ4118460.1 TonB family protein [Phaeovulum sp.]